MAPEPAVFGFVGHYEVGVGRKWTEIELLCSCRQSPEEIHNFSGHLKRANLETCDFQIKIDDFLRF